jgi:hypothetical protein
MANRKISDLTALTAPATGDLLPIVDISEAAAAAKNKKITFGELFASIPLGTAAAPSVAFEGYPGLLARSVLGRESYKSDDPARRLDAPRRAARERLVNALEAGAHHFETRIDFAHWRADCIEDAGADLLDAVSCAAQAAWAWHRRDQRWGLPQSVDPVEGWIIGS